MGGVTATTAPGTSDDVVFDNNYSSADCTYNGAMYPQVNSVSLDANYTGTLHLDNVLFVGTLNLNGGNIDQPNGQYSTLNVSNFNWSAGVLNLANRLANLAINNSATLTGTNLTTGDDLTLNGTTLSLSISGVLTFNNNAGVSMSNSALFKWDSSSAAILTTGTGMFVNSGGTLLKPAQGRATTVTCDLPYDNEGGTLHVQTGKLEFDRAGAVSGVSVLQNSGLILLGDDNQNVGNLGADRGLKMAGGGITTAAGEACQITGGDLTINGGVVNVGNGKGAGKLTCDGNVDMSGGNGSYAASVDLTAQTCSLWVAKSFKLGGTTVLQVTSVNIPNPLPVKMPFTIMHTTGAAINGITGDFSGFSLAIGDTGKSYSHGFDPNKVDYIITTP